MTKDKFMKLLPFAIPVLYATIILVSLYVPEAVGVANNGDFIRVLQPNRITFTESGLQIKKSYEAVYKMILSDGSYVQKIANFLQSDYSRYDYLTSQSIPIKISKILNLIFDVLTGAPHDVYNMFWLFFIYDITYAYSFYLILSYIYKRFGACWFIYASITGLIVFCDQGYTLYFNSLYGEALQLVSTFLCIGLFLRLTERMNNRSLMLYYAAVAVMATSKTANIPVGLLFSVLPLSLLYEKKRAFRVYILACSTSTALLLLFFFYFLTPDWIERDNNFDAVFDGVLVSSKSPGQDLKELGLDPSYAVLAGLNAYSPETPINIKTAAFKAGFYGNIGKAKIVIFYLEHPGRFLLAMEYSAGYADYIRAPYLTNMQNSQVPAEQSYRFSIWEYVRVRSGVNNLCVTAILLAAAFSVSIRAIFKSLKKGGLLSGIELPFLIIVIIASAATDFIIPYIGNGICDIGKHMFGFIHFYDIIIFFLIGMLFSLSKRNGRV